jgi:transcription antitermination factor NusG
MTKTFKSKPTAGYKWYVVYTQPRNEKKCAESLREQNIQYYLPLIKTIRQWSDRKKKVELPLFPSYMFVFVSQKEYYDVLNVPGISRYLFFEGKPATIRQKEIDQIKMLLNADIDINVTAEKIQPGEMIEITHGALRGVKGEMVAYKGERKVAIRIQQIDFSLLIHVPVNQLKVIGSK